jgi:hypothetical protein
MSSNPYTTPEARLADHIGQRELDVTWEHATKVWWSSFWRSLLYSIIAGSIAGFLIGVIAGIFDVPDRASDILSIVVGAVLAIPVNIWVMRIILQKSWSGFRLAVVRSWG